MPFNLGFHAKYIWNSWSKLFHPAGLVDKFNNSVQISLSTLLFLKLVNVSVVTYHSSEEKRSFTARKNLHYFKVKSYNLVCEYIYVIHKGQERKIHITVH